jgi:hypothetical protein
MYLSIPGLPWIQDTSASLKMKRTTQPCNHRSRTNNLYLYQCVTITIRIRTRRYQGGSVSLCESARGDTAHAHAHRHGLGHRPWPNQISNILCHIYPAAYRQSLQNIFLSTSPGCLLGIIYPLAQWVLALWVLALWVLYRY